MPLPKLIKKRRRTAKWGVSTAIVSHGPPNLAYVTPARVSLPTSNQGQLQQIQEEPFLHNINVEGCSNRICELDSDRDFPVVHSHTPSQQVVLGIEGAACDNSLPHDAPAHALEVSQVNRAQCPGP